MANKIQVRRGLKADLPVLSVGELAYCTDTKEMYIGTGSGNKRVDITVNNTLTSDSTTEALSAAQGKALYDGKLGKTETAADSAKINGISLTSEQHRVIFRGKNLGSTVTAEQKAAIQNGTFEDLYLGDYWEINGIKWRIADFNYWYNSGDGAAFTKPHLVMVPDTSLYNAAMNDTNITTGGYMGSKMYTENLVQAKTLVTNAFGTLLLTRREYLVNAVTNGYPSGRAWTDSTVELMNEIMVYGSSIFTPSSNGTTYPSLHTVNKSQLALFAVNPKFVNPGYFWWLRDVTSASRFASMGAGGNADSSDASTSRGVRPVFAIG